jgi:hypothetical protein
MNPRYKAHTEFQEIRLLIWIYFLLVMLEGVLRKWVLPGLSDPLLLVRDPFLILIYIFALIRGVFPMNGYVTGLFLLGALASVLGITAGSGNLVVTAYGFDSMFLHLPLIFIFPQVFERKDVIKMGYWVIAILLPMALVMVWQFRAPPEAWINCGAGGGTGAQLRGALGKIRPPGFFTFITGAAQFLALATSFVIFGFWKRGLYPMLLLALAGFAITIAAVVSTSRLVLGGIGLVFMMIGVSLIFYRQGANHILRLLVPIGLILLVATNLDVFKEGREVFEARLQEAGDTGTLTDTASNWTVRVFGDFLGAFEAVQSAPLLGSGLGVGTNVGARMLSGELGFLLAEGEWARIILELGPFLGFTYLLMRILICIHLLIESVKSARVGNALPILFFGACALLILIGQFSQSNTVGFAVIGAGLCLASTNVSEDIPILEESGPNETRTRKRIRRGRSPYAAALHDKLPS